MSRFYSKQGTDKLGASVTTVSHVTYVDFDESVPIPPSKSVEFCAGLVINLIRKHLDELLLILTPTPAFRLYFLPGPRGY